ncbi:MAG TPA: PhnD/SsuA/transferrin family substrate-binding protein [Sphaerochaeta sp.]|nr:PhnD/SsuA/transferrin family substrate-binding protein [Sphaerochaeta sp.]
MKRTLTVTLVLLLCLGALFAQGAKEPTDGKTIKELSVYYVPSREPAEIITVTEPLKELLIAELANNGYVVENVKITVGTTYEAVGVALSAGTADIGLIPANTFLLYEDGCEVILTATRDGLSVDSDDPRDWNNNEPITAAATQAIGYRALMIAGPSAKGKELSAKVQANKKLTWEDINSANWSVMSSTSPAGYVYPTIFLMEHYDGKTIGDLAHTVQSDSYGSAFARLAVGQVDVLVTYADARRDQESKWMDTYGRKNTIWEETDVIGVTPMIYNDTVSVSRTSEKMTPEFIAAVQESFMSLNKTEKGKKVIAVYSHTGYQKAVSSDYDNERKAQNILRGISN